MKAREKLLSNSIPHARYFSPQFFGMSDPFQQQQHQDSLVKVCSQFSGTLHYLFTP